MAELRLTFRTYAVASTFCVLALVFRTWYIHEELYTVVAVLTTHKVALAVLYNFVFMVLVGTGKVVLHVLLGQLRDLEVEQVLDSGRGFLLDTVLFLVLSSPTLDGADVSTYALAKFLLFLVALKTAHLVVQIRGATIFEVGHPRVPALLRVCLVLSALLSMDLFAVHFFLVHASRQSTFYLWLLFECLGMLASCVICVVKFGVHLVDVRLDNGWTSKSAVIFYLELVHDVTSLGIFLLFMTVFFVTQPSRLPLYMTADIIHVVKALYKRILSLKKYRSLTRNLETRFPDATPEELEAADTCIICRDFLFDGSKKLPCTHIFHIDCLRSWLVQQQSCPTCRAEIPTDDSSTTAASAAAFSGNAGDGATPADRNRDAEQQQQQQQRTRGDSVASQAGLDGASSAPVDSSSGASEGASGRGRQERIASCFGIHAAAASSTVEEARASTPGETAAGGHKVRLTREDVAGNLHNSARDLKRAEGVSDPLALLDMRVKRSSERLEAAAATALAAAASAAAVARPAVGASLPCAAYGQGNHVEQLEAALRQRVTQTEAVVTDALAQALALSYHMCDLYRLHASLWTVEAQHAQLEVCRKLLQQTPELRRRSPPAPVSQAHVSAVGGQISPSTSHAVYTGSDPAAMTGVPSAASASDASASTSEAKKPQQQQDDVQKTEIGSLHRTPLQTINVNEPPVEKAILVESTKVIEQLGAVAAGTSGQTGGYDGVAVVDGETSRDFMRREVGRTEMRENNEKGCVVVCPSHLFQQGNLPCIHAHNIYLPMAPFPHGIDGGHPLDDGVRVKKCRGDGVHHALVSDMHSSSVSSVSSHHDSLAMLSTSNTLPLGAYGIAAATGHCPFCCPRNAAPDTWQNMRGVSYSGLLPRPLFTDSSCFLQMGVGAQQHVISPPSSNLPATAGAEQDVITSADQRSSSSIGKPMSGENMETPLFPLPVSVRGHVSSQASNNETREDEAFDSFSGSSPHAVLLAEESVATAPAELQDKVDTLRSSGTGPEAFEGGTSIMAAELDKLRKEQHRRWKRGMTADNVSYDV